MIDPRCARCGTALQGGANLCVACFRACWRVCPVCRGSGIVCGKRHNSRLYGRPKPCPACEGRCGRLDWPPTAA